MWDEAKQAHLDTLRAREDVARLTTRERQQLDQLYAELDGDESERLRPSIERMDEDAERLLRQNAELEAVVDSRRWLLARMQSEIAEWLDEHERLTVKATALVGAQA